MVQHVGNPTLGVNAHLLEVPGGRWRLNTPSLILDLDRLDENIATLARLCRDSAIGLRPHAKTHKSIEIARRQIMAGAVGICCAKLGEAEVLAAGGIESLLITSPVVTEEGCRRLAALNKCCPDLMIVTDCGANVERLSQVCSASGRALKVLVDLDVGHHRTGIAPGGDALALAQRIAAAPGLHFVGIQGYAGHLMHVGDRSQRRDGSLAVMQMLAGMRRALEELGLACPIVTGGGTGTFDLDPRAGVLTDLQAGSYLFMDVQYGDVWDTEAEHVPFGTALFVQTTVISANVPGQATTDAGLKAFATDAGPPRIVGGAPDGTHYMFRGDEQGGLKFSSGAALEIGATITCAVPHCDPTVNLYDHYHVVRGDTLVDIWPVDARGRSQ
ncbi:DSD1 family PLP-dependent enzyme [Sphingosinicella sp. CPCC 101087]|uniref:DSD1 family PLP-dependent enzyme n=1 Tax=Sphingosinicella sp. CPCC 101087 TaxID=2497754 RepID=UPI00101DE952|nr:DSD1 family PLP-dependent enzyme [Sphingosinicella sp. CPCC 101087]